MGNPGLWFQRSISDYADKIATVVCANMASLADIVLDVGAVLSKLDIHDLCCSSQCLVWSVQHSQLLSIPSRHADLTRHVPDMTCAWL